MICTKAKKNYKISSFEFSLINKMLNYFGTIIIFKLVEHVEIFIKKKN